MTKHTINYQKCVMYKIECKTPNTFPVYVFHTTDFKSTKYRHRKDYTTSKVGPYSGMYSRMIDTGGLDNYNIEIIETFPCTNLIEANAQMRELYRKYNSRPKKIVTKIDSIHPNRLNWVTRPVTVADYIKWQRFIIPVHNEVCQRAGT